MRGNIYLVGFMGSGKSTVGRRLAQALHRRFVDMDLRLEERFGLPIPEVFRGLGEGAFREAEADLLVALSRRDRLVVATGGGVVERAENRALMRRSGRVVHLDACLETCVGRLSAEARAGRPVWTDEESARSLLGRRKELYGDCDLGVSVDRRGPEEVTQEIVAGLMPDRSLTTMLDAQPCPISCTWNAPEAVQRLLRERKALLLADTRVAKPHLAWFLEALGNPPAFIVPQGERSKSLHMAQRLYRFLLQHRMERGDFLVALGGGVVTDLGAFVAATYKRGMAHILVSTTLLGCVDAAIGGKAALNLSGDKNVIGAFTKPSGVVLDMTALATLPGSRLREGIVEAYKTGLMASPQLVEHVSRGLAALLEGDLPALHELVGLCAEAKARLVSEDFREGGVRRILNFGHTFGHALEGQRRFRLTHGQAVGSGMIVAARISRNRGLLSSGQAEQITATIRRLVSPPAPCPDVEEIWTRMQNDKKVSGGRIVFALLRGVGDPVIAEDVSKEEMAAAMGALRED
jgi:shikimate kinase / 3-dehydroquinate synthase